MDTKYCMHCEKEINLLDKHVVLGTYRGEDTLDETYFHYVCWIDFFNRKVTERLENVKDYAMDMFQNMIGNSSVEITTMGSRA